MGDWSANKARHKVSIAFWVHFRGNNYSCLLLCMEDDVNWSIWNVNFTQSFRVLGQLQRCVTTETGFWCFFSSCPTMINNKTLLHGTVYSTKKKSKTVGWITKKKDLARLTFRLAKIEIESTFTPVDKTTIVFQSMKLDVKQFSINNSRFKNYMTCFQCIPL